MKLDLSESVSNTYDKLVNSSNKLVEILENAIDKNYSVTTKLGRPFDYDNFRRYFGATSTRFRCAAKDLKEPDKHWLRNMALQVQALQKKIS